jgi:hypothetical protein
LAIKNLLLTAAIITVISGQGPSGSVSELELRLFPIGASGVVPEGFTFEILNTSEHDVFLPTPELECTDAFTGYVVLKMVVKTPNGKPLLGRGCAVDRGGNWPPILQRVKSWKVLHAGEAMTLKGLRKNLLFDDTLVGTYEFWAEYNPPSVSPADSNLLRGSGIEFSERLLKTDRLRFVRKP